MKLNLKLLTAAVIAILMQSYSVKAGMWSEWVDFLVEDIKDIRCMHRYDVYVPFYAWHNRLTYDRKHIKKYNENPWGAGFGISRYNSENTWSGLYFMAFDDSNNYLETYFGYARQWNWTAGEHNEWRAGIGYTLGLTQRHEYAYIPVPLPLPLIGVGYRRFNIQAAYVPGVKNDGNVLFAFARYEF